MQAFYSVRRAGGLNIHLTKWDICMQSSASEVFLLQVHFMVKREQWVFLGTFVLILVYKTRSEKPMFEVSSTPL